jgi:hypothetical protein
MPDKKLKHVWAKDDLAASTVLMLAMGSLMPIIAITIHQAPVMANQRLERKYRFGII